MKKKPQLMLVLAGGYGTRLHPLTINLPKPLLPVSNRPILELILENILKKHGFNDITMVLYHKAAMIEEYFGDGSKFGMNITHVRIPGDLGTAGAVKYAARGIQNPFIVFSGDILTNINLNEIVDFHRKKKALATVALTWVPNPLSYGIALLDKRGRIKSFFEKPSWSEVFSNFVNAGIYVFSPGALNSIPNDVSFDISRNLFPLLLEKKERLFGFATSEFWKDIGDLEEYGSIHSFILSGQGFKVGEEAKVSETARLEGDGIIGAGTTVEDNCSIQSSVIGKNCKIQAGAFIKDCIIWDNVEVGRDARLEASIVGHRTILGCGVNLEKKAVIGDNVAIGDFVIVRDYVKIWPDIKVPSGVIVHKDITYLSPGGREANLQPQL